MLLFSYPFNLKSKLDFFPPLGVCDNVFQSSSSVYRDIHVLPEQGWLRAWAIRTDRIPCVGWLEVLLPGSWECCQRQMTFEFCWRDETWNRSRERLIDMQRPGPCKYSSRKHVCDQSIFWVSRSSIRFKKKKIKKPNMPSKNDHKELPSVTQSNHADQF